jgi:predicted small secreted protein
MKRVLLKRVLLKRFLLSVPLFTAIVLLVAFGLTACNDLEGTAVVMTALPGESTTSISTLTPTPGQPTTTAPPAGPTATTGGPAPTAASPPTTRAAVATTTAPPAPTFPPYVPTVRIEDEYGGLAWDGSWSAVGDPGDSGGTSRFAEYAGSSMKVYFNGTSVSFITRKGPAVGYVQLELDGVPQPIIDPYNPSWVYQQLMWSSGTIGSGDHTLKVIMVGDSNPGSASKGIYVDAFDVQGTPR